MNQDQSYLIFLGSGGFWSKRDWDKVYAQDHSSADVLKKFGLKYWYQFLQLCGHEVSPFTPQDMIRYGKAIGIDISSVTPERWDQLRQTSSLQHEDIPNSEDIRLEFGPWKNFQKAVKTKPSLRKKVASLYEKVEEFFLEGCVVSSIAQKTSLGRRKVEEYLESVGLFTPEYIKNHFSTLETITEKQIMHIKYYEGEEKKIIRGYMPEMSKNLQRLKNIRYLGLAGVNFIDYALLAKTVGIIPEESLVAEYDKISGHIMFSLIRNWNQIQGGEILRRLKLYLGGIEDALKDEKYREMQFDVINLDWVGGWAKDKQTAIKHLFAHKHLADEAVIFITLNDSKFEQGRAARGRGYEFHYTPGDTHIAIARGSLENLATRYKRQIQELFTIGYEDTVPMITGAYLVKKKNHKNLQNNHGKH